MHRLPHITKEIYRIGCDRLASLSESSSAADQTLSTNENQEDEHSSEISDKEQRVKKIEEYPRPLAVVGTSVL